MAEAAEDRVVSQLEEYVDPELIERLLHLDAIQLDRTKPRPVSEMSPPDRDASFDFDVVFAGGGLSMLAAPLMAEAGLKVGIFERARAGAVHREWNASGPELDALVRAGIVSQAELAELINAKYDHGVCRWHGGGTYRVKGVLDHAVDATGLLGHVRGLCETRGVEFFDGTTVSADVVGTHGVALNVVEGANEREVSARVLVDARGASSPYASADLVCPTVGGVMRGLTVGDDPDTMNPRVGDILATTENVEDGRQHIWEGFPGRPGETTVYLFYYSRRSDVTPRALASLYARYFETRERYKRGDAELVRPTFGYIPGWSRLTPAPRSPGARCLLSGDAAARHSPLTYCGFGSMLRSFEATAASAVEIAGSRGAVKRPSLNDAPVHRGAGALSMMMSVPPKAAHRAAELNQLLDTAFETLHGMGNDAYAALLRDEMPMSDFVTFLRRTSVKRPRVWRDVFGQLGPLAVGKWGWNLATGMMER